MRSHYENLQTLEETTVAGISLVDLFYFIIQVERYQERMRELQLSQHEKFVCWERAELLEVLKTEKTLHQPLQILVAGGPYIDEHGEEKPISHEMAELVGIYWQAITELKEKCGNSFVKALSELIKSSNENYPFLPETIVEFCSDQLHQLGFTSEDIAKFREIYSVI